MHSSIRRTLADDGTATVTVQGEIDFANADELADCVRDAVLEGSPSTVQVDLRGASFIDSTGLGALIEGYRAASDAGVRFVVTNPTWNFRRVLMVTGLTDLFGLGEAAEEDSERAEATGA
nr:STAS domain-containing protein [uncultured Actinoplanes sp.]